MKIHLHRHPFNLSDPYTSGHVLTQLEAEALNRARARVILKQALRRVSPGFLETTNGQELAKATIEELDRNFQFGHSPVEGKAPKPGLYQSVLHEVAVETARAQSGNQLVSPEALKALMDDPQIQSEARARTELRQNIAETELARMLGLPGEESK